MPEQQAQDLKPSEGRVPPNDLDAEAAVLSAVFMAHESLDRVADILAPEQFYSDANRRIYEAQLDLNLNGKPVDTVTVKGWLQDRGLLQRVGGIAYLVQVVDAVPAVANVATYAERIRAKWQLRQLISTCQEIAATGYGTVESEREFIAAAEQRIYAITTTASTDKIHTLREALLEAYSDLGKRTAARAAGKEVHVRTGIVALDNVIGGLRRGNFDILAARPSMGKTSLALNIATYAAGQDLNPRCGVLILTLETRHTNVAMRINCSDARYEMSNVVKATVDSAGWAKLQASAKDLAKLPIMIKHGTMGLAEIGAYIRRARSELKRFATPESDVDLGLVIMDYLQLGKTNQTRGQTRENALSALTRGLKNIAIDCDIPFLALSQLNRGVEGRENKRPSLGDLRETGEIENAADTVIMLYRDEYYNKESADRGIAEAIIAKSKDTATGTVRIAFNPAWMRFADLETSEQPDPGHWQDRDGDA